MQVLLDYAMADTRVEATGGGHPLDFTGASLVTGPSSSTLGRLAKALRLGGAASAKTGIAGLAFTPRKFTLRAVVRAVGKVAGRQNIVESSRFPFALYIDKGKTDNTLTIVGSVNTTHYKWRAVDSRFRRSAPRSGRWLSIDLVYDHDTLALFLDEQLVDIQAFPRGALASLRGSEIFVGSWVDGRRNRFQGDIAALQLIAGAPEELEAKLDEARSSPAWHISRKRVDCESKVNLGAEASGVHFDNAAGAYRQDFQRGLIMYHDSIGAAFEMHGAIWSFYKGYGKRNRLGYLITDESNSTKRGGRKSLFSKGGIYWSGATGARPVLGQIYLDYENLGEGAAIGLPTGAESLIPNGRQQVFQGARMYHQNGAPRAHEVHGAILTRYLRTGGPRKWGFPVTDEVDVMRGRSRIGRSSEFQGATFFWSRRIGAFEVHGDIRRKYEDCGGPAGELGFPTSDERAIPGAAGARMNTFEKGSICWYGTFDTMVVARPFKIFVGRVSTRENEGFGMGQNDLYTRISASDGAQSYAKRHPRSGDWGNRNSKDINLTIPNTFRPTTANYKVSFRFKCTDADPGNDDHLGTFTKELNAANGWGLRHRNGVYNSSFSKVRSLTWSVKPQVDVASLSQVQKWWGEDNASTNKISYQKYARAFRDVDSDAEWWDLSDWLEKAFYELVVEGLADGGNCFGMALEGIYARKNRSIFGMPLDRFKTWSTLESEFNIKHCYQVGAQAIWWFVGQFVTGNTHDPEDVFNRSLAAHRRGENPVICIAQNYDFSGGPHCILPVGWRKTSSTRWEMDILDPNFPGQLKLLTVNPRSNTFRYVGSRTYSGGEWSGGRFHYMPYDILDSLPRTPIWDAILLLLAGTVIVFGSDAESVSIKDDRGRDLDAFGNTAKQRLQRGEPVEDCFFDYTGFAGDAVKGGMLFRRNPLRASVNGRTAHAVLADGRVRRTLSRGLAQAIGNLAAANHEGAFDHRLRGRRRGKLEYAVCSGMTAARLDAPTVRGEVADFKVRDLDSSKQSLALTTPKAKLVNLTYETRLGAGKDRVEVQVGRMPAQARKPLQVNLRPGIGGVDLVTAGERVDAQVSIKAVIDGKRVQRAFTVPVEGGARFHLGAALDQGELTVGRIDRLFGRPSLVTTLRPRG